jgi:hypothetical protein
MDILDGIDGEVIGDFGLSGGGAAGFELDRADFALGTPPNALILARSEGHQSHFGTVLEELLSHLATLNGERRKGFDPRRDRLFRDDSRWYGVLDRLDYVLRQPVPLENVLRRFAGDRR